MPSRDDLGPGSRVVQDLRDDIQRWIDAHGDTRYWTVQTFQEWTNSRRPPEDAIVTVAGVVLTHYAAATMGHQLTITSQSEDAAGINGMRDMALAALKEWHVNNVWGPDAKP